MTKSLHFVHGVPHVLGVFIRTSRLDCVLQVSCDRTFVRSRLNFCVLFGLLSFLNGCAVGRAVFAGLSARAPEFDPRLANVVFVVDRVALGQIFLPVLRFSPVTIIAAFLHTHLYLDVAFIRRTNGEAMGTVQQQYYFGNRGSQDGRCFRPLHA